MKRRDFVALGASTASMWPLLARAQRSSKPVIGFIHPAALRGDTIDFVAEFRQGLSEGGFVDGQNVAIEYRWAEGKYDQLPQLAADLARRAPAAIAAFSTSSTLAAKGATSTIPIVFVTGDDPVEMKLVSSLSRPGGNVTGVTVINVALSAKRLELLHELVPAAATIAVMINPTNPNVETNRKEAQDAARKFGRRVQFLTASSESEIEATSTALTQLKPGALAIVADGFFNSRSEQLAALVTRHSLPAMSPRREFAAAGGLASYGPSLPDAFRQVGVYIARILKGAKPVDLPVLQPTRFELTLNLKTAKRLRLAIPQSVRLQADKVIE